MKIISRRILRNANSARFVPVWGAFAEALGPFAWCGMKNFPAAKLLHDSVLRCLYGFGTKKYFGGMEKGCIFAPAFDGEGRVLKSGVGSESILKRMRG